MSTASSYDVASRVMPSTVADAAEKVNRCTPYGDRYTYPIGSMKHALSDEGSYLVATNPTPSTPVAYGSGGTQASFSATAGLFVVKNNATAGTGRRLFMDYIGMIVGGTVPASATSTQFAIVIDGGSSRTPTANATLITPVNLNLSSSTVDAQVWCPLTGIPTVPAASASARLVHRGTIRSAISIVLDEYLVLFGGDNPGNNAATAVGRYLAYAPPVSLGPQEWMVFHLWQPSAVTNPLSVEFSIGMWMR